MTTEYTPNFRFNLPDFRMGPWHDLTNTNTTRIDELLMAIYQGVDTSPWMNNTLYTSGETAVDPADNSFWVCIVQHTSAPVPTTFAADRAAHPGYWNRVVVGISPRGQWTNSTHYLVNDMVTDAVQGVLAVCITEHTSNASGTIRDDHVYWSFIADISGNPVMEASFIDYDDSTGYTGSTNVDGALDYLAGVTHTQGTTIATHTTQIGNNTTNIATNATNITAEKNRNDTQDGLISANSTAISAKISEAPNDAKQYARQSLGWHEVTGFPEAPLDSKKYARMNAAWTEVGDAAVLVSDTPPASPKDNTLWWESDSGTLYIRYNDGDSAQWVVAVPQLDAATFTSKTYVDTQDALRVAKAGDTMTNNLTINTSNPGLILDKTNTLGDAYVKGSFNGSQRWLLDLATSEAESSGNVGSNYQINRYNDAGAFLGIGMKINRSDGLTLFPGHLTTQNSVWSMQSATTGTFQFGTSGNKYLQYDGATFYFQSGSVYFGACDVMWLNAASASSPDVNIFLRDETGTARAAFNWIRSAGAAQLSYYGAVGLRVDLNGLCVLANGFYGRQGNTGGIIANGHNFDWTGTFLRAWVNSVNIGNVSVSSDYRTKKDVIDLPGMWDTVKALRPIKYTHADFTPPAEIADVARRIAEAKAREDVEDRETALKAINDGPMFKADDIERWGFVAHELQEDLLPSAATGEKDSPDTIQSPDPMTIIAALTRALQEAMERIEILEAKIV